MSLSSLLSLFFAFRLSLQSNDFSLPLVPVILCRRDPRPPTRFSCQGYWVPLLAREAAPSITLTPARRAPSCNGDIILVAPGPAD